ncbi:hypothetical protein SLS54_000008 [Diplodia seriata]
MTVDMSVLSDYRILAVPAILYTVFCTLQAVYRLYFHPLAKFRGPRVASISSSWLDKQADAGNPEEVFEKLHQELDTRALRIAPNELHISDVSLYKVIYNQAKPFPKHPDFYKQFNTPHTLTTENDERVHKELRKLLNPLFSRSGYTKLEPVVLEKIYAMGAKIKRIAAAGPINMDNASRCMTADIISEFAFGQSFNLIDESPNSFDSRILDALNQGSRGVTELYHHTFQRFAAHFFPRAVTGLWNPTIKALAEILNLAARCVEAHKQRSKTASHPVIFDNLASVSLQIQNNQALEILIAGSDTTAQTITMGLHYILGNPRIKDKLTAVVHDVVKDPASIPTFTELDQIEYLRAVVKESLRMAMPVPGMLRRVVPKTPTPFSVDGQVVPPGTVVGMSAYTMHYCTDVWGPDAKEFNPDRWLGGKAAGMETYFATFSKGARSCIGMNVAQAEVTMALAYLFRAFRMELKPSVMKYEDMFTTRMVDCGVMVNFEPL